jgi:hypothetical protein
LPRTVHLEGLQFLQRGGVSRDYTTVPVAAEKLPSFGRAVCPGQSSDFG